MQNPNNNREDLYKAYLSEINGIKFTNREIDIIVCILHNRGNKKIANLLAIAYRTVEAHIYNITCKINKNSRDDIIDFIEKSGKVSYLRQYYSCLLIEDLFTRTLINIAKGLNKAPIIYNISAANFLNTNIDANLVITKKLKTLQNDLKLANIILNIDTPGIVQCYLLKPNSQNIKNKDKDIVLLFDDVIDLPKKEVEYLDFTTNKNYYFSVFDLLEKIIYKPEIDNIKTEFQEGYNSIIKNIDNQKSDYEQEHSRKLIQTHILTYVSKIVNKNTFIIIISIITVSIGLFFYIWPKLNLISTIEPNSVQNKVQFNHNRNETWNLPQYLDHYIDRKALTDNIFKKFGTTVTDQKSIFIGLYGLGGVGKTTLAKNIICNPQRKYDFRAWFSAETEDLLKADYFNFGEKFNLFAEKMSDTEKINAVKEWLSNKKNILLVYDNVDDINIINKYFPNTGNIIITSRNPKLPGAFEVNGMTEKEALSLLDKLIPKTLKLHKNYHTHLLELIKELGFFPLALSQAGAYIAQNLISVSEYLELYRYERKALLETDIMPILDLHKPAYISWKLTMNKLTKNEEGRYVNELLKLIACCYAENIPRELAIQYLFDNNNPNNIIALNKTLSLLTNYSFIKLSADSISVHRLVHLWIQDNIDQKIYPSLLEKVTTAIVKSFPERNQVFNKDLLFLEKLLIQAETILLQSERFLDNTKYLDLLFSMAKGYYILSNNTRSKQLLEQVYYIKKKQGKLNHIETVNIITQLGMVNLYLGEYDKSLALLKDSLEMKRKYFGEDHIETAYGFQQLGKVYFRLGNYKYSDIALKKAFHIIKRHFGEEHIETSYIMQHLGNLYHVTQDYQNSKALLEIALKIKTKHFGSNHIDTAYAMQHLGNLYRSLNRLQESLDYLIKSFEIKKDNWGEEHLETSYIIHDLAKTYMSLCNYKESIKYLDKAYNIQSKKLGLHHIDIAYILHDLGVNYFHLSNYSKSIELLNRSLLIKKIHFAKDHSEVSKTIEALKLNYINLKDYNGLKNLDTTH